MDKKKELEEEWNINKGYVSMEEEKERTFKIPIQKDLVSLSKRQEPIVRFSLNKILIVSVSLIEIMRVCVHIYSYVCLFFFLTASGIKRPTASEVSFIY